VKRLRALLRDRATRRTEGYFVAEGPRVVALGLDAAEVVYVGADASAEAQAVADRALGRAIPVRTLAAGVSDRVSDTQHPQGVFALAPLPRTPLDALDDANLVLVCEWVSDPGNAGTLIRSAAAAGAGGVVFGRGSVDAYNPKVVRASAGACFAVPIVEDVPIVASLERFDDWHRVGAVAEGGVAPEALDLTGRTVLVLGNETHGLSVDAPIEARVTIPMHAGESVNVAMAGTVLMFEAARQRRSSS
jgi:RNA methyltransferase, TrmH family